MINNKLQPFIIFQNATYHILYEIKIRRNLSAVLMSAVKDKLMIGLVRFRILMCFKKHPYHDYDFDLLILLGIPHSPISLSIFLAKSTFSLWRTIRLFYLTITPKPSKIGRNPLWIPNELLKHDDNRCIKNRSQYFKGVNFRCNFLRQCNNNVELVPLAYYIVLSFMANSC